MASWKISVCSSLCLLVLISALVQVESKRSQPHILFMLADDLGWIDVGLHGSKIHTPNIDSLAKDGVILNNFYAQPVCTPARGALMTGRYPIHTGHKKIRIQEIVRYHNPEQPLFLYMAFQNVHNPIQAPEEYVKKYDFIDQRMRRVHAGMVDILDEAVGNITKAFKDKGLWDDTLTIFCTDNGGEPVFGGYNWPLRGTKHTLWEGGVRSTGFVHGKMLKRKGAKCDGLLHISDFFPTLINLAGGKFDPRNPIPVDGFDVWKTISQGDPSPRTEILLNIDNVDPNATLPGIYQGMGLRMGSMKLLMNVPNTTWFKPPELGGDFPEELLSNGLIAEETDEDVLKALMDNYLLTAGTLDVALYNITADPEERNDLSQVLPDVVKKMKERMDYYINSSVPPLFKGPDPNALKIARKNGIWGPWM
ncbi:PREDICTED: arylsulfatase B-like [Acropora digitifera]|uniref:arylsulfatase B-like n=1 Tax=Acropora digitifera TaxID=70779 RepID=UPI00077A8C7A|nr:PREDICTED: arylsulfatase B-like [Acropora digitifera]